MDGWAHLDVWWITTTKTPYRVGVVVLTGPVGGYHRPGVVSGPDHVRLARMASTQLPGAGEAGRGPGVPAETAETRAARSGRTKLAPVGKAAKELSDRPVRPAYRGPLELAGTLARWCYCQSRCKYQQ